METQKTLNIINGVNLDILQATIGNIQDDPELAKCRFHIKNKWIKGTQNRSIVSSFYGAKQEIEHEPPFELKSDEPKILAGKDEAPNPVENLLNALAGCVTTGMVAHAAVRGIDIHEVESELEGDIDVQGFLGISPDVPRELTEIRMKVKVKANPRDIEKLQELAEFSPIYNTLLKGVKVDLKVEPK